MSTTTLPLGTEVEFRSMTGTEENLLANQAKVRSGEAINELLANCVTHVTEVGQPPRTGDDVTADVMRRLREPDRKALLFAIRRESFGDTLHADLECQSCRERFAVDVDLSLLPSKPPKSGEDGEPDYGPYTVTLASPDGKGEVRDRAIVVDFLDGRLEAELNKTKNDLMTMSLFVRIKSVEGVPQNKVFGWLKALPVKTLKTFRQAVKATECGVDSTRTADCPSCGQEVAFDCAHQPDFFFPTE